MSSLAAGDLVLATVDSVARVVVNQHVPSAHVSSVITLHYAEGTLSLTPDHVLLLDGKWAAARFAKQGSRLSNGATVQRVTGAVDGIINPLTTTGTILANGIVASTYPEWVADHFLAAQFFPLPISACSLLSFLFPAKTQAFYDAWIEPIFSATGGNRIYLEAVPPQLVIPTTTLLDLLIAAAFTTCAGILPAMVIIPLLLASKLKA